MIKPPVSFERFIEMDIRVGTIISAEAVLGSGKLLKIEVDFGDEVGKKQILSGIAKHFTIEDLVNKHAVFLVNLETKMIMGLESQGMLLVAEEEGKIVLLKPCDEVKNGSVIR